MAVNTQLFTNLASAEVPAPLWEEAWRQELAWQWPLPLDLSLAEASRCPGRDAVPQDASTPNPEQMHYLGISVQHKQKNIKAGETLFSLPSLSFGFHL